MGHHLHPAVSIAGPSEHCVDRTAGESASTFLHLSDAKLLPSTPLNVLGHATIARRSESSSINQPVLVSTAAACLGIWAERGVKHEKASSWGCANNPWNLIIDELLLAAAYQRPAI